MPADSSFETSAGARATGRYPDFIIGGAPKCGTTSVHFILDQHPEIALPEGEIHYFDADDPVTHPDFMKAKGKNLSWWNPDPANQQSHDWYVDQFAPFAQSRFIGEDSTTYIFSPVTSERIHALLPDVKLVFMLRNPVQRAYSQYWHMMNSARTALPFTKAISRYSSIVLGSTYTPNLKRFFERFPRDQIKIVLFEDFIADQQGTIDEITDFIGAPRMVLDPGKAWFNKTKYTHSVFAQRMMNLVGRPIISGRYRTHMVPRERWNFSQRVAEKMHYLFFEYAYPWVLTQDKPPAMPDDARRYLESHLTMRNKGLSELLGRDMKAVWGLDI